MSPAPACPSCRQTMQVHRFSSQVGLPVELDVCFSCQGLWFDRGENLKLTPDSVVSLFRLLHENRCAQHRPLASTLACTRCDSPLEKGFDVVRSGRYITYRCGAQHGRISTFSAFMVEKGFVRHMTRPEIADLAQRVGVIHCTSCGAPVDIRKDHACPYCKAAFSLIDPQAVVRALDGYAQASARAREGMAPTSAIDIGDALVALERERSRAARERQQRAFSVASENPSAVSAGDLLAAGVSLVWALLKD